MNTVGRRAFVTGASSGIGAAIAREAASRGYRVALFARRTRELEAVRASLARPSEHLVLPGDVRDPASVQGALRAVGESWGALDLAVNDAGIGYRARIADLEPERVRDVLETNVAGVLHVCQAALPLLRRGERPVVVNVSSVVGRRGYPTLAVYAASKAAVCSIGESLRLEWAREGIAVCTLLPGRTVTAFFSAQPNPARLPDADLAGADMAEAVARIALELDLRPRPEVCLRRKWRWLGVLSLVAPRIADRLLATRIGEAGSSSGS